MLYPDQSQKTGAQPSCTQPIADPAESCISVETSDKCREEEYFHQERPLIKFIIFSFLLGKLEKSQTWTSRKMIDSIFINQIFIIINYFLPPSSQYKIGRTCGKKTFSNLLIHSRIMGDLYFLFQLFFGGGVPGIELATLYFPGRYLGGWAKSSAQHFLL